MILLGVDVETSGLEPEEDFITEIAFGLFDAKQNRALLFENYLIDIRAYTLNDATRTRMLSMESQELTGIYEQDLQLPLVDAYFVAQRLSSLAERAEFFVAHNAPFDKAFVENFYKRDLEITPPQLPWIDTVKHIPYAPKIKVRKLDYLAMVHGQISQTAHRAVFDIAMMFGVLKHYPIEQVVENALSPVMRVISNGAYSWKEDLKEANFRAKYVREGDKQRFIHWEQDLLLKDFEEKRKNWRFPYTFEELPAQMSKKAMLEKTAQLRMAL